LENLVWFDEDADAETKKVFASAHNDGSYILWDVENGAKPKREATTPYGPYPCKRIEKVRFWKDPDGEQMCVFSGGMPRAAYGDHFTVTVKSEGKIPLQNSNLIGKLNIAQLNFTFFGFPKMQVLQRSHM
jgi:WD40 repeat protein